MIFSNFRAPGAPGGPTPIFCKLLFSTKFRGGAQIGVQQALSPLISLQIMTSAAQLTLIIDELLSAKCADQAQAFALLEGKGLLPAKLKKKPVKPVKPVSRFASQVAQDACDEADLELADDFMGSGTGGKITVKDIKDLIKKAEVKVNASPAAKALASANGIDIGSVNGSGPDGKVLVSDLKTPEPKKEKKVKEVKKSLKITPAAKKLAEKWQIDEDDLREITGTGADGAIKGSDMKELVEAAREAWEEEETPPSSEAGEN